MKLYAGYLFTIIYSLSALTHANILEVAERIYSILLEKKQLFWSLSISYEKEVFFSPLLGNFLNSLL